jgi:hypothetical protein
MVSRHRRHLSLSLTVHCLQYIYKAATNALRMKQEGAQVTNKNDYHQALETFTTN